MALIPGVSRSGGTITAGLFLGLTRPAAVRYSFLLAIPAVVAAGLFQIPDVFAGDGPSPLQMVVATVIAFVARLRRRSPGCCATSSGTACTCSSGTGWRWALLLFAGARRRLDRPRPDRRVA